MLSIVEARIKPPPCTQLWFCLGAIHALASWSNVEPWYGLGAGDLRRLYIATMRKGTASMRPLRTGQLCPALILSSVPPKQGINAKSRAGKVRWWQCGHAYSEQLRPPVPCMGVLSAGLVLSVLPTGWNQAAAGMHTDAALPLGRARHAVPITTHHDGCQQGGIP